MVQKKIDKSKLNKFTPETNYLEINDKGNLEFDGFDCVELANEYNTPLYVISKRKIRENYRKISSAFKNHYKKSSVAYALKANPTIKVLKTIKEEGGMAEVISTGELFLAEIAGFGGSEIIFNGVNKDRKGIGKAIKIGALINVDSFKELEVVEEEAKKQDTKAKIGIRINPVVKTGTLDEWETAIESSKFGINIENGLKAYKKAKDMEYIKIKGIHSHIGSQIEDEEPYEIATERIMEFINELKSELDIEIQVIDMGGGFPIPHRYKEVPSIDKFARTITKVLKEKMDEIGLKNPKLILEPGGSIIGNTSILLLKVGMIKHRESSTNWAYVDGGANIILRATQGWYVYQTVCCNKMNEDKKETYNIGGPLCYSGDVLGYNRELPSLEEGDILGMLDCGAYTMAILNRYNSHPFPAIVMLEENNAKEVKKRETFADLVENEKIM